jgi:hypothetical protein
VREVALEDQSFERWRTKGRAIHLFGVQHEVVDALRDGVARCTDGNLFFFKAFDLAPAAEQVPGVELRTCL